MMSFFFSQKGNFLYVVANFNNKKVHKNSLKNSYFYLQTHFTYLSGMTTIKQIIDHLPNLNEKGNFKRTFSQVKCQMKTFTKL